MPEEFMTTPADEAATQNIGATPARLGFVFQSRASAVDPKENFLNYLTQMNMTRSWLRSRSTP